MTQYGLLRRRQLSTLEYSQKAMIEVPAQLVPSYTLKAPVAQRTKASNRIGELDALRGFAAIYVMLHHYLERYPLVMQDPDAIAVQLPISGQFAVHLFFMISGFVIFLTLGRCGSTFQFARSRVVRIFPTYWTSVVLTTFALLVVPVPGSVRPYAATVLANLSLVHQYFNIPNIDGVYWSLAVEAAFYVWVAVMFAFGQVDRVFLLSWIWLAICVAAFFFQDFSHGRTIPGGTSFSFAADSGLLLRFAPLFIAGIAFYKLRLGTSTVGTHLLIVASLFVFLAVCVYPGLGIGISTIIPAVGIYAIFYLMAFGYLRWLDSPVLVFFGTISYALYVTHSVIGNHARYWLRNEIGLGDAVSLPLTILFTLFLATAVTFWIERPCARLLKRRPVRSEGHRMSDS